MKAEPGCIVYRPHRSTKGSRPLRLLRAVQGRRRVRCPPQGASPRRVSRAAREEGLDRGQGRGGDLPIAHRLEARPASPAAEGAGRSTFAALKTRNYVSLLVGAGVLRPRPSGGVRHLRMDDVGADARPAPSRLPRPGAGRAASRLPAASPASWPIAPVAGGCLLVHDDPDLVDPDPRLRPDRAGTRARPAPARAGRAQQHVPRVRRAEPDVAGAAADRPGGGCRTRSRSARSPGRPAG